MKRRRLMMEILLQFLLALVGVQSEDQTKPIFSPYISTATGPPAATSYDNSYVNSLSYSPPHSPGADYGQDQDFGSSCDATRPCNKQKYLECVDDKCVCENSLHRTYNPISQECVNLVGHRCAHAPGPTKCVPHAVCDVLGKCRCKQGYSASSHKLCLLSHDERCTAHLCNTDAGLACKENRCKCLDSLYVWTPVHQRCINPEEILKSVVKLGKSVITRVASGGFVG